MKAVLHIARDREASGLCRLSQLQSPYSTTGGGKAAKAVVPARLLTACCAGGHGSAGVLLKPTPLGNAAYASCLPVEMGCKLHGLLKHARGCRCVRPLILTGASQYT